MDLKLGNTSCCYLCPDQAAFCADRQSVTPKPRGDSCLFCYEVDREVNSEGEQA